MSDAIDPRVRAHLERWERAGLLSTDQRRAIEAFEREPEGRPEARISAVVEVLVYLGVAAVLGAIFSLLSDAGEGARAIFLFALSAAAGGGGAALRGSSDAPTSRAASILWLLSVAFIYSGFAYIAERYDVTQDAPQTLLSSLPALLLALTYWRISPRAPQFLAAYGTFVLTVFALADSLGVLTATSGGLIALLIGVAGYAAARGGLLPPEGLARTMFALTAAVGVFVPTFTDKGEWAETLGVLLAGGMLWLSVRWRAGELLVVGATAMFAFVAGVVARHFAESLGVPLALLLIGGMLIGAAVLVARLRPLVRET